MTTTLNATTSNGLVVTPDNSGTIQLQSNGTTELTISSAGAYGQLISGTAVASTSGTSIDFTGIPSWVKRITVLFSGVSTNGTSNYLIQLGNGSIVSTGYDSGAWSANTANSGSTAGFVLNSSVSASGITSGTITLSLTNTNRWVSSGVLGQSVNPPGIGGGSVSGGFITLGGTLDRVRITTVNGTDTFDSGSINILYEG